MRTRRIMHLVQAMDISGQVLEVQALARDFQLESYELLLNPFSLYSWCLRTSGNGMRNLHPELLSIILSDFKALKASRLYIVKLDK